MKKANVINWLGNYQIEDKKTPLDNEIILHAYGKTSWIPATHNEDGGLKPSFS